jgi:riboflavin biosynthesis pyrimidine reductase
MWAAEMSVQLSPLQTLFDVSQGPDLPLDAALARLYGALRFLLPAGRPLVIGNFVATLDGVVALDDPSTQGGGEISGHNAHDRMVMGLLRAVSDAVVVGAGTLRADGKHVWTATHIYPGLAAQFAVLRQTLGLTPVPLNVVVTTRGEIDLGMRVFASGEAPVLVVTTRAGETRVRRQVIPPSVQIAAVSDEGPIPVASILTAIATVRPSRVVLVEGGPRLISGFFAARLLDEMFLTVAPQVAGRDGVADRPGFVAGTLFAPDGPRWGQLVSVKRAESHLFLRYLFAPG